MSSVLRSIAAFAFVSALAMLAAPGCSQQGEGERCDSNKNGDLDCDSDLTCVKKGLLIEGITDRCCPAEGTESDKRCARGTPGSSSAGTSSGGTAGAGGTDAAGTAGTGGTAGSTSETSETGGTGGTGAETSAGSPATDAGGQGGAG